MQRKKRAITDLNAPFDDKKLSEFYFLTGSFQVLKIYQSKITF